MIPGLKCGDGKHLSVVGAHSCMCGELKYGQALGVVIGSEPAAPVAPIADTVDVFRARESETWKQFLSTGSVEDLLAHQSALRALNGEVETRVQMLIEAGRITSVRTSGRAVSP